jgi:hypothetical protein
MLMVENRSSFGELKYQIILKRSNMKKQFSWKLKNIPITSLFVKNKSINNNYNNFDFGGGIRFFEKFEVSSVLFDILQ